MYTSMLELAISMILLYLLLSAASSAIQEIVANLLRWRAATLEKGIAGLLKDKNFTDELYKLPLISGLCSPNARGQLSHRPSYIPPATFALAVLQLAGEKNLLASEAGDGPASKEVGALLQSLLHGTASVEEQKKRLEAWFNDSMDRISGWYKRKAHAALWIIGAAVVLLANGDSISLANTFWSDSALRSAMVTAATDYVKHPPPGSAQGSTPTNSDNDGLKNLDHVRSELSKINVPLGWCWKSGTGMKCFPNLSTTSTTGLTTSAANESKESVDQDPRLTDSRDCYWWLLKFLGLAVTTLAISQGAPFWFDLMQKAVNLRLSGDAPNEKK